MPTHEVSHNDIYEAIGELRSEVRQSNRRHAETEKHVAKLESFSNKLLGAILTAGAAGGVVSTLITLLTK